MTVTTAIRKLVLFLQALGIVGLIGLMGMSAPLLSAQQTQSNLQEPLALHGEVLQEKEAIAEELNQVIELNLLNTPITLALKEIARKTDLKLMYSESLLPKGKKVTVQESDITLDSALWKVLEGTGIRFALSQNRQLVLLKMQESKSLEVVQETITGRVTDAQSGDPLPAVNVAVKGTAIGTSTNEEGIYELANVPSLQDTLIFSFIGYETRAVPVEGRETINVQLTPRAVEGDEVVVTAFGLERDERSLGYSTQSVAGSKMVEAREPNLASSLKGKVAGVNVTQSPTVGGSSSIIIRGVRSITGNNQPLIVVDGMPIDNQNLQGAGQFGGIDYGDGLGNINPDDIDEITVLKGPNAAALYGARAANGAVLITTKKGFSRAGVGIEINSNVTIDQFGLKPRVQNKYASRYTMDWDDWPTTRWLENDVWTDGGPGEGVEYKRYSGDLDQWGPPLDGSVQIILNRMRDLGPVPALPQPRDNFNNFFDDGVKFTNSIAFSGGNDRTTYRVSASNLTNDGVVPKSKFDQNSVTLRVTSRLSDRMTIDGRANYVRHNGENRPVLGNSQENIFKTLMYAPRFVNLDWIRDYKMPVDHPWATGQVRSWRPATLNPYWTMNEIHNEDQRDRINGFLSLDYNIANWLSAQMRASTDTYADQRYRYWAYHTRTEPTGRVVNNAFKVQENNADLLLTANNDINKDFNTVVSLGANYMHRKTEQTGMNGTNLEIRELYHISNANNVVPNYHLRQKEMQSLFGTAQIGFRDYLYLDLSGRNDWSSTLGVNNQSFFYPSGSMSFVFSDAFDLNSDYLTFGKIRASYAQTGVDARPYLTNKGYGIVNNSWNGVRMADVPGSIPLLDLKNELTESYEIGGDFRFVDNRIGFDITLYRSLTSNQIFTVDVSGSTGYSGRTINAGEVENKGIEFTLDVTPVQIKNFSWDVSFNFNRNRSELQSLAEGVDNHLIMSSTAVSIVGRPGEPFGQIEGTEFLRNDENEIVLDQEGTFESTDPDDPRVLGNIQPDWTGGLSNTFNYRGFSLGTVLDMRFGGEMFSMSMERQNRIGNYIGTEERQPEMVIDGVIPNLDADGNPDGTYRENDIGVPPHQYYGAFSNIGEKYIVDGGYISLRELTIGYTFNSSLLGTTPFSSVKVSAVGRNLLYLKQDDRLKEMGLATESSSGRGIGLRGVEHMNFPLLRTIGFNVNLQF